MTTDKPAKAPMYQYIMDDIKRKIETGRLKPHDQLPPQIDLANQYGTSEITTRRALSELVLAGYVYRIRGKGSFVQEHSAPSGAQAMREIYFVHRDHDATNFNHPFFTDMFQGIRDVCARNGIGFHVWDMGEDYALPEDKQAGIVLLGNPSFDLSRLAAWQTEGRKIVTVHFYYPHLGIPYVIVDNLTGGYLATQHLISHGHRRIGIILTGASILELNQEFSLRLQGYKLALSQHQIPFDPELVSVVSGEVESTSMGRTGFKQLMALPNPPTAVFATSDYKAMGALNGARELGLIVPEDVSVMGYDDVLISALTNPGLSTVNQNTRKLGERSAEILLFELKDAEVRSVKDEIVPALVIRGSTGPVME
ncbi:LacI family transcriptional regulator [Paenibacillus sp. UNC496MF]|uniref:GntR family transcriptional regulator n=1 Tax=Paenibacillus sp. UNC496MF TaxID=1502753 RepID=UPI0008E6B535|nr:GntR family transcriptional regulator [Paenibacillus sp. UNC496MF]SFJ33260.1 LacI family transcriptional regulator [Paenibacillus sp. UNC496MF]